MITCSTLGLMTVPFYLYDPSGFSPLRTANKLGQFQALLPSSGIVLPVMTALLAFALSSQRSNLDLNGLLRNCALVLAFPVLAGTILLSIQGSQPDFSFAGYGLCFLFPGAVACWKPVSGNNPADAVRTGALLGLQGTTAFGSASLAFLRFMKGPVGAGCLLSLSVLLWIAVPFAWAVRRLGKADM